MRSLEELVQPESEPATTLLNTRAIARATGIVIPASSEQELVNSSASAQDARLALSSKPLSVKELEILRWATEGKTAWEISKIRCVSQATVKFHLRNIYCKLQVNNRAQAVVEAIKRGLCK